MNLFTRSVVDAEHQLLTVERLFLQETAEDVTSAVDGSRKLQELLFSEVWK